MDTLERFAGFGLAMLVAKTIDSCHYNNSSCYSDNYGSA